MLSQRMRRNKADVTRANACMYKVAQWHFVVLPRSMVSQQRRFTSVSRVRVQSMLPVAQPQCRRKRRKLSLVDTSVWVLHPSLGECISELKEAVNKLRSDGRQVPDSWKNKKMIFPAKCGSRTSSSGTHGCRVVGRGNVEATAIATSVASDSGPPVAETNEPCWPVGSSGGRRPYPSDSSVACLLL